MNLQNSQKSEPTKNLSELSALSGLPNGWKWVKLGDVCEILDNKRVPVNSEERDKRISGKPIELLFPYYGATGQVGYIDDYLLNGEYVLLGEDGAPFLEKNKPKAYLVKGKIWVNNHAHILLSKKDNKFLCYYLNYIDYYPFVTGTTRLKLNQSSMKQIPLIDPPLAEQKKIVEKIEELFSQLDSGVAALKKAKEQIRLYRQSVLAAAFSGRLNQDLSDYQINGIKEKHKSGKILNPENLNPVNPTIPVNHDSDNLPNGWKWVKLGEVSEKIQYGYTESASIEPIGPKFLRITDIQNGNVNWEKIPFCQISDEQKSKYLLNEGDIVFARTGATVGKSFLITGKIPESVFASYLIRIQLSDIVSKKFIYYFFQSTNYWRQITEGQVGIGQPNVNGTKLSHLVVPFCSIEEQLQIVSEIEKRFSEADNLEKAIDESLAKAERLRQSILKQAFSGKLIIDIE